MAKTTQGDFQPNFLAICSLHVGRYIVSVDYMSFVINDIIPYEPINQFCKPFYNEIILKSFWANSSRIWSN